MEDIPVYRTIREEQDKAYEESLRIDRAKVIIVLL